jgi:hypothetical protein
MRRQHSRLQYAGGSSVMMAGHHFLPKNVCPSPLVSAEHENYKERTHHKTGQQYPAKPSPYGGRLWVLSGVSCAALETNNVIRSAAGCFSTTPHWNYFSTGRAFSSKDFHDYLSTDKYTGQSAPVDRCQGARCARRRSRMFHKSFGHGAPVCSAVAYS